MAAVRDKSQIIGEFLEWLPSQGVHMCHTSIEELLAKFFRINLKKCEKERQALLDYVRACNA